MREKTTQEKKDLGTYRGPGSETTSLATATGEAIQGSVFTGEVPKPLMKLTAKSKRMYYDICEFLIGENAFQEFDSILVCQLCFEVDLMVKLSRLLGSADDCVEKYKSGSNVSGKYTAYRKAAAAVAALCGDLCIGIKSRQNVAVFINKQLSLNFGSDPWKEISETHDITDRVI